MNNSHNQSLIHTVISLLKPSYNRSRTPHPWNLTFNLNYSISINISHTTVNQVDTEHIESHSVPPDISSTTSSPKADWTDAIINILIMLFLTVIIVKYIRLSNVVRGIQNTAQFMNRAMNRASNIEPESREDNTGAIDGLAVLQRLVLLQREEQRKRAQQQVQQSADEAVISQLNKNHQCLSAKIKFIQASREVSSVKSAPIVRHIPQSSASKHLRYSLHSRYHPYKNQEDAQPLTIPSESDNSEQENQIQHQNETRF